MTSLLDGLTFDAPTHVYRMNGRIVPHVTEIIPSNYSHVPPTVLNYARDRGKAAHRATELFDLHRLDWSSLHDEIVPRLHAWIKFLKEFEVEFLPEDIERLVYHPLQRYAGTPDRNFAYVRGRPSIIEIKSIAAMGPEVGLQTAGLMEAENLWRREHGLTLIEDRWGVQLPKTGVPKPIQYTERSDLGVFLSYLKTLTWEVKHGKRQYAISNGN